jgi:glycerol-3-phosphate cytidylyltransferase-like family protein
MARARKSKVYFTRLTDIAISAYNKTEAHATREKIYRRFIYPPFMKLAENIINKIKPDYIDSTFVDLQTDLVTYLTARLDKFNPANGKAYSYYTRTSFNYIIAENQKGYAKVKSNAMEIDIDDRRNIMTEIHNDDMRETLQYFMDAYIEHCYDNLNYIFTNPTDIHVADSILHIFETRENIENFNKKALYIYIRERTGLETTNITKVIKVLKNIYETKFKEYERVDFVKLPF